MHNEKEFDYTKLKFKAGLEIHQQLDTKKLFCNCPSILRNDEPDFVFRRRLHAVAGESGKIDIAAQYQASLKKEFLYQFYNANNCLVELDESPPYEINPDALKITLQIAILLNCKIIPISQIMRKIVIDGSNTSGFQRTVLIARDGWVETSYGRVNVDTICLEEDSARKILDEGGKVIYRLDRLGMPLVEVSTAPDIHSPQQAKEVALHIGNILRSCKVKRGIGTIRQDVNVSILNGNRIELKGMQNMKTFVKTIENEVLRQKKLYDKNAPVDSEVRNALANCETEFLRPMPGAERMYPETDLPLLKISRELINETKKNLPKLKGEIEGELKSEGLSHEMIKLLLSEQKIEEFKSLSSIYKNPNFIAKMLLIFPKEISSKLGKNLNEVEKNFEDFYPDILNLLNSGRIFESDVKGILIKLANGVSFKEAVRTNKEKIGDIEEKILKIIGEKPGLGANAYMGLVMKEFSGKINGKEAMEIIQKLLEKSRQ